VFDTLIYVMLILIWPLCLFIIGLVLLQGGAGDMSSAFGGGGQLDSTLGVGAGRKMSKLTGWLVFVFLVMVTVLAIPHGSIAKRAAETAGTHGGEKISAPPASGTPAATPSEEVKPPVQPVAPIGAPAAPAAGAIPAQAPASAAAVGPAPAAPAEPAVAPAAQSPAAPAAVPAAVPAAPVPAAPVAPVPGAVAPASSPAGAAPAGEAPAHAPSKLLPE
jgi:protein translocase SecG subunit